MTKASSLAVVVAIALTLSARGYAAAQTQNTPVGSSGGDLVSLDFANNGQRLTARVGQQIEISLGTVGPRQYGTPEVSSPAIQLVSTALAWPLTPGGTGFVYIFEAAAKGEARVRIPANNSDQSPYTNDITFIVTIRVLPAAGRRSALQRLLTPDQANTAPWQNAWTNLNNFARQTFTPSLPRLTGVEVELVVANPGPTSADVSLMVMNAEGIPVAQVSKTVPVADCNHVLFILPHGGLPVSTGQTYSIVVNSDGGLLGWKYVVGGYPKGAAWFNNKPLLRDTRSSFLFRTFGAN